MPLSVWKSDEPDFRRRLSELVGKLGIEEGLRAAGAAAQEPPQQAVRRIIADVRERGDEALIEHTQRLDGCKLTPADLRVTPEEIDAATRQCPAELLEAMGLAAERIRAFQQAILLRDPPPLTAGGRTLGLRYRPVDSAGIYVPGGAAPLASSVLMAVVPARVAGVGRIAVTTPPQRDGSVSADRLAAARIAGAQEVYRIGGAQAIAALAFGTETVAPVDFIAGPGNIYTTLAKKEVFGQVGIEMLPGPSEVVILADGSAEPSYVAADLIAQAEHNPGSAILLTDSDRLAAETLRAIEEQLRGLPRADVARACLEAYGAVIVAASMDEAIELTNELAPEHLEIMARDAAQVAERVRHAGAIFVGQWSPVAVGDYVAGPSHVLPTSRTARFSSGLTANDFLKRSSLISYEARALSEDAENVQRLAEAEGLNGHARSVGIRLEDGGKERQ